MANQIKKFNSKERTTIECIQSPDEMQNHSKTLRAAGETVALVPTMGYFHEGHLSLMHKGRAQCSRVAVSIFVNPTQFGPNEDFKTYPRDLTRDLNLAREAGVDIVFTPRAEDMYPAGFQTEISLQRLPKHLCGLSRPTHFAGVATVVTKLLNIVQPHCAIFGRKDYQQLTVIRQMVSDLNMDVTIIDAPTVREADGLAMSSRNTGLSAGQRHSALCLYQALLHARNMASGGVSDSGEIIAAAREIITAAPETEIDYIAVVDPQTLDDMSQLVGPARMALAVQVGGVRLIDNMLLTP